MSMLEGEFFNLLSTSESRWTTLVLEGRTWIDLERSRRAWQAQINRMQASGEGFAVLRSKSTKDQVAEAPNKVEPAELDNSWSLRVSPERRRAKFVVGDGPVDVVIEGPTFWSNGFGRSFTNGGRENVGHGQGEGQYLIETADYAPLLRVEEISEGMRLGRHTIEAKVTTLENTSSERGRDLHGLTTGDADYLELSIDRERGIALSVSSWYQGAVYRKVEVSRVEFDPIFAPEAFRIEPQFGDRWSLA